MRRGPWLPVLAGIVVLIISLAGCAPADRYAYRNVAEQRAPGHVMAQYDQFDGVRYSMARVRNGQVLVLEYDVKVATGRLTLGVRGPLRLTAWRQVFIANDAGRIEFPARPAGRYVIEIRGQETRGSYDLRWATASGASVRVLGSPQGYRP